VTHAFTLTAAETHKLDLSVSDSIAASSAVNFPPMSDREERMIWLEHQESK
jgi:hypothetical protein